KTDRDGKRRQRVFADRIFDIVDDVPAHVAHHTDRLAAARPGVGDQIVYGDAEAGEPGFHLVDHVGASVGGKAFNLLAELREILTKALQVLLETVDIHRRQIG